MQRLWYKLHRLRPHLLKLNKFTNDIQKNKLAAREKLDQAQQDLRNNIMDAPRIEEVKRLTDEVIHWNEMEEKMLMQRSKIDWIRAADNLFTRSEEHTSELQSP